MSEAIGESTRSGNEGPLVGLIMDPLRHHRGLRSLHRALWFCLSSGSPPGGVRFRRFAPRIERNA